jgi:hypothetical protein
MREYGNKRFEGAAMNVFTRVIVAIGVLSLVSGMASAQTRVYESREADGTPVFSDTPAGESEAVDLPATNITVPNAPGDDNKSRGDLERAEDAAEDAGPPITIVGESGHPTDTGDGFVEEQTPEGPVLVNKRERDKLDQDEVIYQGSHRIVIEQPRPHQKEK